MPKICFSEADSPEVVENIVWWAMHYPNDPARAFEAFVKTHLAKFGGIRQRPPDDKIEISADWLAALLIGPSIEELEVTKQRGLEKGVTAGAVMLIAHLCEQLGQPIIFNTAYEVIVGPEEWSGQHPRCVREIEQRRNQQGMERNEASGAPVGRHLHH